MEDFIKGMMDKSAKYFQAAMMEYHPARPGKNGKWNGLAEANVLHYFGVAAHESGGMLYPEVPFYSDDATSSNARMDLMLYFKGQGLRINVEAKRLFDVNSARGIVGDFSRIKSFNCNMAQSSDDFSAVSQNIALIISITQYPEIRDGWCSGGPFKNKKSDSWRDLKNILNDSKTNIGSCKVDLGCEGVWHCDIVYAWQMID